MTPNSPNGSLDVPSRRALLTGAAALFAFAALSPRDAEAQTALSDRDQTLVDRAAKCLESLQEVQGRFEQTNARGVVQTGAVFLKRPGKARFQYDPPSGLLVVSDGRWVSIWDSRLRTFSRAPFGATPLAILLTRHVRLDQDVDVFRVANFEDGFYLSARKASGQARTEGYITLVFGDNPMQLRGWTLVDGQGQATKVRLLGLEPRALKPELFVLDDPRKPQERGAQAKSAGPAAAGSPMPQS